MKLYSRAHRFQMRKTLPTLRMSYQLHSFMAGKERSTWETFQKPYFDLFNPPKENGRTKDAPYSVELIECFEFAMQNHFITGQHMARLGLEALRDSGAEI